MKIKGIHHVTTITASALAHFQFYSKLLGMRLLKKSVNQDDPSMYHLFYGNNSGTPGTALTAIEIPLAEQTVRGNNSISALSLDVPDDESLKSWQARFDQMGIINQVNEDPFGRKTLAFKDPDGLRLQFVSRQAAPSAGGESGAVITGIQAVKLTVPVAGPTIEVLNDLLGFHEKGRYASAAAGQPEIIVFESGDGSEACEVHIEKRDDLPPERLGRGGIHHIAFRVCDVTELKRWANRIQEAQLPSSGLVDRYYFQSVSFRERNGILFELATDGPGFTVDETPDQLGKRLSLPPALASRRKEIEAELDPLDFDLD